jgi:hypothetical protein
MTQSVLEPTVRTCETNTKLGAFHYKMSHFPSYRAAIEGFRTWPSVGFCDILRIPILTFIYHTVRHSILLSPPSCCRTTRQSPTPIHVQAKPGLPRAELPFVNATVFTLLLSYMLYNYADDVAKHGWYARINETVHYTCYSQNGITTPFRQHGPSPPLHCSIDRPLVPQRYNSQ